MTTAVTAARIERARYEGLRNRLIGEGMLRDQAERWIDSWRRLGGDPSTSAFWDEGYVWIRGKIDGGGKP